MDASRQDERKAQQMLKKIGEDAAALKAHVEKEGMVNGAQLAARENIKLHSNSSEFIQETLEKHPHNSYVGH